MGRTEKLEQINVAMSPVLLKRARKVAEKHGYSLSELTRQALRDICDKLEDRVTK
jgi:hypothetical protein